MFFFDVLPKWNFKTRSLLLYAASYLYNFWLPTISYRSDFSLHHPYYYYHIVYPTSLLLLISATASLHSSSFFHWEWLPDPKLFVRTCPLIIFTSARSCIVLLSYTYWLDRGRFENHTYVWNFKPRLPQLLVIYLLKKML